MILIGMGRGSVLGAMPWPIGFSVMPINRSIMVPGAMVIAAVLTCLAVLMGASGCGGCEPFDPDAAINVEGVGYRDESVLRADGSQFQASIYYPASGRGIEAPIEPGESPFPVIGFGHGFLLDPDPYYASIFIHLAANGYVVVAPRTQLGIRPSHSGLAGDLQTCLTFFEEANRQPGSKWFGLIDSDAFGMSGHSMGGGAGVLATAADSRIKALANLAAAETSSSAIEAMSRIEVPTSLISGGSDEVTPIESNGRLMFNNGAGPRLLPVIEGGTHFGFCDRDFPLFTDCCALPRERQLAITRDLLLDFFNLHLKQREPSWSRVWGPEAAAITELSLTAEPGLRFEPVEAEIAVQFGTTQQVTLMVVNSLPQSTSVTFRAEPQSEMIVLTPEEGQIEPDGAMTLTVALMLSQEDEVPDSPIVVSARRPDGARTYALLRLREGV